MTEPHEAAQRIADLFAMLNPEIPSEDTDLIESGLMDSLQLVEFLTCLEDDMGVSVPIDELEPDDFRSEHHGVRARESGIPEVRRPRRNDWPIAC